MVALSYTHPPAWGNPAGTGITRPTAVMVFALSPAPVIVSAGSQQEPKTIGTGERQTMTSRERVLAAVEHGKTDRAPADYQAHKEVTDKLIERLGLKGAGAA